MPSKRGKATPPRKPRRAKAKRRVGTKRAEKAAYIESLIAHGQAVAMPPGGRLPPGATHELKRDEKGRVKVVRKRFSAL